MNHLPSPLIKLGVIAAPHGVRGQIKIRSFTAIPEDLTAYGPLSDVTGERHFSIKIQGQTKDSLIASLQGVTTREQAEALKGTSLYIPRHAMPEPGEDEFYYEDLIGMSVSLADGAPFGKVKAVHNHGAGELLEILKTDGSREEFAFTHRNFPVVNTQKREMTLELPEIIEAEDKETS